MFRFYYPSVYTHAHQMKDISKNQRVSREGASLKMLDTVIIFSNWYKMNNLAKTEKMYVVLNKEHRL